MPDDQRDASLKTLLARDRELRTKLRPLNDRVIKTYPDYAALANASPLTIAEVQNYLASGEALMVFQMFDQRTVIWTITKDRWGLAGASSQQIADKISSLRCGLDEDVWAVQSLARRCADLLGLSEAPGRAKPLPFDLNKAYELYTTLFNKTTEDLVNGKRLLIVSTGPLSNLPFSVLVTSKPKVGLPASYEGYREIPWLARTTDFIGLPDVASLKGFRGHARAELDANALAYLGYGNPQLSGSGPSCRRLVAPSTCPSLGSFPQLQVVGAPTLRNRGARRSISGGKISLKRSSLEAVLGEVRALCPLSDTAYEITCVAESLGKNNRTIRLADNATKADLKSRNASGELARYRIIHFATHGLLGGEIERSADGSSEPALVLTPPDTPADAEDNGLLKASEIATFRLNADWVVLSACNTASASQAGGGALSGLALVRLF